MYSNCKKFPDNYYGTKMVEVYDDAYKLYHVKFNNLFELYRVLKSNPFINRDVFQELASEDNDTAFAGKPYEDALEDLINLNEDSYNDFLNLIKELTNVRVGYRNDFVLVKSVAGGHINIPAYSAGDPLCCETYERVKRPKFVRIHSTLSYPWTTNKKQVLNKAIILISIINALEKNGYVVNLNSFELSKKYNEIVKIDVKVKNYGGKTNLQTLYKTNCHVEFLRRILFRVLETMDVNNDWCNGYGVTCDKDFAIELLKLDKNDIYFGTPNELNIKGKDLVIDFNACLRTLKLEDKFNINEVSDEFKESVKRLI